MNSYSDHAERWDYIQEVLDGDNFKNAPQIKRKYITRMDVPERQAHYWHLKIRVNGFYESKTFCDLKCGGKSSALLAAVLYRDKVIREQGIVFDKDFKKHPYDPTKGVYKKTKTYNGYSYDYWIANWHETVNCKRVRKSKAFSTNKYGKIRAKQKATKYRKEKLKELYG